MTLPIDCDRNKHSVKVKTISLDLAKPQSWETLRYIIRNCNVAAVHIAPPCGTSSRAREKRLNNQQHGPRPLRNERFPYGIPNLRPHEEVRVKAANALYINMAEFCLWLLQMKVTFTIENPTNSWLWRLPCMKDLVELCYMSNFHNCAYGGLRFKCTSMLTNDERFLQLDRECQGDHQHLPWGQDSSGDFVTASESEYPKGLCEQYALVLQQISQQVKRQQPDPAKLHPQKQRPGRSCPPLIPEYIKVVTLKLKHMPSLSPKKTLTNSLHDVPAGSKLLRSEAKRGANGEMTFLCVFGIFHSKEEFTRLAMTLQHPFDDLRHLPDCLKVSLFEMLSTSKVELSKRRLKTLQQWRTWAAELEGQERSLRASMHPHVAHVLRGKRLLLLEKLAGQIEWPDRRIHQEIREGFRLVGSAEASGIFKQQVRLAELTEDELMKQSSFLRPALIGKANMVNDSELGDKLYQITCEEATSKHWLEGPYSHQEVSTIVGDIWLPVRRFAVVQKEKVRPIDDFCENHLNRSFSSVDKISLKTMDHILWSLLTICKCCLHQRVMNFVLSDGRSLNGEVHSDWTSGACNLKSTTLDLKSAYKQLPLHMNDRNKAIVTLKNPASGKVEFFLMNTLPFGAVASVLHFNRVSNLIWALGCHLGLVWGSYFDDFPLICPATMESSTMAAARAMLQLLGFQFADDKLEDPSTVASVLGVELDLGECQKGIIKVRNKQSRVEELKVAFAEICKKGSFVPAQLPPLLGRMQFADLQIAGRSGKLAMADLCVHGTTSRVPVNISGSEKLALELLDQRLTSGIPRVLTSNADQKPFVLFTDGALEYEGVENETAVATIGVVAIDPSGRSCAAGCKVPQDVMRRLQGDGKTHVIGLIEMYACICAIYNFSDVLRGRKFILFVDNYPAQDCIIKGSSSEPVWRELLLVLERIDQQVSSYMWVCRVPSESNISDCPSRGSLKEVREILGDVSIRDLKCPLSGDVLDSCIKDDSC